MKQTKETLPPLVKKVAGSEIKNYRKQNKAMMSVFSVIEYKLDKALREAEKDDFSGDFKARQIQLLGERKVLRELLTLKPES